MTCRFLGTRPIRLIRVAVQKNPAILALSSRSWLNYTHQNRMHFTPLILDNLDYAWGFSAELCPEGLIGIAGSTLRLVAFPHLSSCGLSVMRTRVRTALGHDEIFSLLLPIVPTEPFFTVHILLRAFLDPQLTPILVFSKSRTSGQSLSKTPCRFLTPLGR